MGLETRLTELMRHEAEALAAFDVLLAQEHAAIKARDGAVLQGLADEKRALIERLELLATERSALLATYGLAPDRAGFESLLGRLEGARRAAAEARWTAVREALFSCHKQNQVNGLLLEGSLRSAHQVLGILLGHSRESDTYTSQGALRVGPGAMRAYAKA
jgi:flagella synthesis protein FlgN